MKFFKIFHSILVVVLFTSANLSAQVNVGEARGTLDYYLDLLQSGNYESAKGLWEVSSYARATRLAIDYKGIPVKPDLNSPAVYYSNKAHQSERAGIVSQNILDDNVIRFRYIVPLESDTLSHYYYIVQMGQYHWLISPQDYFARDWLMKETDYFRIYYRSDQGKLISDIAAEQLDQFIDSLISAFAVPQGKAKLLKDMKIDYYYCENKSEIELLNSSSYSNYCDPATDAVITENFPDFYAVSRLMINFHLKELYPFTADFLPEGLAAYMGGRWQRSSDVIFDFGRYIMDFDLAGIDSLFMPGVFSSINDLAAPVAVCFNDFLLNRLGQEKYFAMYRALSGEYAEYKALDAGKIKTEIQRAFSLPWGKIPEDFNKYMSKIQKERMGILPGGVSAPEKIVDSSGLTISASDNWINIEYKSDDTAFGNKTILFGRQSELMEKESEMYIQQYGKGAEWGGYRWALKFDRNEIGLYDYALNQIIAKYVSYPGEESNYYDPQTNKVTAHIKAPLINKSSLVDYKITD